MLICYIYTGRRRPPQKRIANTQEEAIVKPKTFLGQHHVVITLGWDSHSTSNITIQWTHNISQSRSQIRQTLFNQFVELFETKGNAFRYIANPTTFIFKISYRSSTYLPIR